MEQQSIRQVKEVMTRDVETMAANATLQEAAQKMTGADVGPLPVVEGSQVVGMLTDRDIITWAASAGGDTQTTRVRETTTTAVDTCSEDDDVRAVARAMQEKQHSGWSCSTATSSSSGSSHSPICP